MTLEKTLKNLLACREAQTLPCIYLEIAFQNLDLHETSIEEELTELQWQPMQFSFSPIRSKKKRLKHFNYSILYDFYDNNLEEALFSLNQKHERVHEDLVRETMIMIHHDFIVEYKGYIPRKERMRMYN